MTRPQIFFDFRTCRGIVRPTMTKKLNYLGMFLGTLFTAVPSFAIVGGQIVNDPSALPTIPLVTVKHPHSKHAKMTVCTSTIIDQDVVLTAPSCLSDISDAMVVLGTEVDGHDFSKLAKIRIKRTKLVAIQPEPGVPYHEIVIAQLESPLPEIYHRAEMIFTNQFTVAPSEILLAGFGSANAHKDDPTQPKQLRSVYLPNPFINAPAMVNSSLSLESPNLGISYGDAGGPAIIKVDGRDYLWGITVAKGDDKRGMRSLILSIFPFTEQINATLTEFHSK